MGEYADMAVDESLDPYWSESDGDYGDDADAIPWIKFHPRKAPEPKTCRVCGAKNLHWEDNGDGWRLYSFVEPSLSTWLFDSVEHVCFIDPETGEEC